jgi:hypothetical protein
MGKSAMACGALVEVKETIVVFIRSHRSISRRSRPLLHSNNEHIALQRLWTFATLRGDLIAGEHLHLLQCEECRSALRVCLNADNFDGVLKNLRASEAVGSDVKSSGLGPWLPDVVGRRQDEEIVSAIGSLFRLAAKPDLHQSLGASAALEIRIRSTLALGLFMPHEEARRSLIALMASDSIPPGVRSVASEAVSTNSREAPEETL